MNKKARNHPVCEKMPYIAVILGMILPMIFVGIGGSWGDMFDPSVYAVPMGLAAGFGEETMFRIVPLAIVMRYVKKEKRFAVMIVLAVLFGLAYAGDVTQGADLVMTVAQMVHSIFMGFVFTGLYLGTGSVIFPVFAHALHDFISFTTDPSLSGDGIFIQQYGTGQLIRAKTG